MEATFEDQSFHIRPGDMYIYVASTLVRIRRMSVDTEGYMVDVNLSFVIPIVNRVVNVEDLLFMRQHPLVSLPEARYGRLVRWLADLRQRLAEESPAGGIPYRRHLALSLIQSMGQTLCLEILSAYFAHQPIHPMAQSRCDRIFQNFMLALFRHYRQHRDVAFYAGLQRLDPRYLSAIVKERSGHTALRWIVRMVISEARQLLENTDLSVKEISARLNFPTQSFFCKSFKQYVGLSPKVYRSRILRP